MKKRYKHLTTNQKQRNIIFSSELVGGGIIHEIHKDDEDIELKKDAYLMISFLTMVLISIT